MILVTLKGRNWWKVTT